MHQNSGTYRHPQGQDLGQSGVLGIPLVKAFVDSGHSNHVGLTLAFLDLKNC